MVSNDPRIAEHLIAASPAFVIVVDQNDKIVKTSNAWMSQFKVDGLSFFGRTLPEMLPPSTARMLLAQIKRVRDFGSHGQISKALEITPEISRHFHVDIFKLENGYIAIQAVDVSVLMEAQKLVEGHRSRLVRTSQFSALAQLATGIVNEMTNPLTVIHGYASVLSAHAEKDKLTKEVAQRTAGKVTEMVNRMTKVIRGLHNFAREGDRDPFHAIQVNGLIEETLDLCLDRFAQADVQLEIRWRAEGLVIDGRQGQLVQALINLLDNAREASLESSGEKWVRLEISEIEDTVVLAIEDSGPGISPSLRSKVMEPFFTTKSAGRSVGLGLSHAKGIIESHSGVLSLNADHTHTRFEIFIPKRLQMPSRKAI